MCVYYMEKSLIEIMSFGVAMLLKKKKNQLSNKNPSAGYGKSPLELLARGVPETSKTVYTITVAIALGTFRKRR